MSLIVSQSIRDIRGKVLLDAGKDILEWVQKVPGSPEYVRKKAKLKEMAQLMDDLQAVFESEPYKKVLANWVTELRAWVGELWAPSIVFEELKMHRMRDPYSYRHVLIISIVGARLLELWVKTAPTVKKAFQAFLCHDIGKSRVSPLVLESTKTLDEVERQAIYEHPFYSFVLNAAYWGDANHLCAEVALHHHEDRIGKGYPRGVKTNSLILDILALLDRFDALISERPFRFKKYSLREAFDILKKDTDEGKIEPDVLKALIGLIRQESNLDLKKIKLGTINRANLASSN